jgi:hypothetical protein
MKCSQCQQLMVTSKSLNHKNGSIPFDANPPLGRLLSNVIVQGSSGAVIDGFLARIEQFECANQGCSEFRKRKSPLDKS